MIPVGTGMQAINKSNIIYAKIIIDREELLNTEFDIKIHQSLAEHDTFEVTCSAQALEGFSAFPMTKSREFIGQKIMIKFLQYGEDVFAFSGIITGIKNQKKTRDDGTIVICGSAPTILLDSGPDCQSFEKSSLRDIIQIATRDYPQGALDFILKPNNTTTIDYTVQYKESDYDFIKRLATRHGEWFYFNGREIVFGFNNEGMIDLEEGSEMFEYELKMEAVPQKLRYLSYHSDGAQDVSEGTNGTQKSNFANPFLSHAVDASKKLYSKEPVSHYNHSLMQNGTNELRDAVQLQQDQRTNVFFVEGKSHKPNLKMGALVKLTGYTHHKKAFSGTVPLETYRIVALTSHFEPYTGYTNSFVAVPYEIKVPNYTDHDAVPICQSQSAVVVDNNDPNGMSRLRVQFPWQKQMSQNSPWLRVVTPYAGGGKGQHILPEIGEEVLVGFENDNAEKPFVHGALFHGEGKSGHGGEGNFIKSFQTATGIKLVMNDQDKSFLLEDPSGNTVFADGKGNMTLTAPKNMTLNVGEDMLINVGKNKTITVGSNMDTQVGEDKTTTVTKKNSLQANEYKQDIEGNKTVTIGGDLDEKTASTTHKSSGDVLMKSGGVFKGLGATDAKVNKG